MSKVIGIAAEGPTDYLVLKTVIDKITGEDNRFLALQPEPDMMGRYGNGWKGVWKWCKENSSLEKIMDEIQPRIDVIIIQMDGDVVRKEKEVHCQCDSTDCEEKGKVFPLYCQKAREGCGAVLPCQDHLDCIDDTMNHGNKVLREALDISENSRIIITIPCDSTDAWIVAAYDDYENVEQIIDPWKNIIAKGKYYHDVRVRGDKKNTVTYSAFMPGLSERWKIVANKCKSAKLFETNIKRIFEM